MAERAPCPVVDLAHERLVRQVDASLSAARAPLGEPPPPPPRYRSGPAFTLSVEDGDVVLLADSLRIEFTPVQALDLAGDLRELAEDARGNDPAPLCAAELRARLGLIASELAALDRGDKRVTDVIRLARELTLEARRGW